jgi:hypothetical protein
MNNTSEIIGILIGSIVFGALAFFLLREITLSYFKINDRLKEAQQTNSYLKELIEVLRNQKQQGTNEHQ